MLTYLYNNTFMFICILELLICIMIIHSQSNRIKVKDGVIKKFVLYFGTLSKWLNVELENNSISQFFENNNYYNIAIYGMGVLGTALYQELSDSKISVNYGIDCNPGGVFSNFSDLTIFQRDILIENENFPQVDVIVVTIPSEFDNIKTVLETGTDISVISIDEVVYYRGYNR